MDGTRRLRSPILVSLLFHAAVALLLVWIARSTPPPRSQPILLEFPATPPVAKAPAEKDDPARRRIVETEQAQKTQEAAPDAFLGKQTQTVDRQTMSDRPKTQPVPPQRARAKPEPQEKEKLQAAPTLRDLGVPVLPKPSRKAQQAAQQEKQPEREWADQAVSPHDYVQGMRESNRTLLNTKEYVFYSYFERVRRQLETAWYPLLRDHVEKLYRKGRTIAAEMDHKTRILVTLNDQGAITRVQILEESGTRELDTAAVQAFNQAGPFPNPPRDLFDRDGKIEIRWDFILKT